MFKTEEELFDALKNSLAVARCKHPKFAEGPWEALGYISEEAGEVAKEITKHRSGWAERADEEAMDLLTVTARFLLGEHHTPEESV